MGGRGSGQSEAAGSEEASLPGREDVELPMPMEEHKGPENARSYYLLGLGIKEVKA
ncbi:hypothetical protein STEG23_011609, partial [Scotinomys teguina]